MAELRNPKPTLDAPPPFGEAERSALLDIARRAVAARLGIAPAPAPPACGARAWPGGAFVTLVVSGEVRASVGSFGPAGSLPAAVARLAGSAASEDPRFAPVRADELHALTVRIAIAFPRRAMRTPSDIALGRDGVLVRHGWHRGALLPRKAVEQGWDRETFLARACLEVGLPPRAWTEPEATVELFAALELASGPDIG